MAHQNFGPILAFRAGADLSTTGRYRFVKGDASQGASNDGVPFVVLAASSGEDVIGVCTEKPKQNITASVQTYDVTKIEAGAAVTILDLIMTDSVGRAITATGSTKFVLGRALEAAAGAGVIISVQLFPTHYPLA